MTRFLKPAIASAFILSGALALNAGISLAAVETGFAAGKTMSEITASLEGKGYKIDEVEKEDGKIEVEATLNGEEFEIYIDAETGKVTRIEKDDD